jgi:hypothetical protein
VNEQTRTAALVSRRSDHVKAELTLDDLLGAVKDSVLAADREEIALRGSLADASLSYKEPQEPEDLVRDLNLRGKDAA